MEFNFLAILIAAISTFLVGFVWYNPKVFGTIWMKEAGLTAEQMRKPNMLKIFGLTFIYSLMLAFIMPVLVIHQMGPLGMIGGFDFITSAKPSYTAFMTDYGDAFRTYKHGALHGFISGIFIGLPIISINGLFEQKSWKYMAIHAGYWLVIMTIMGSIICGWK
ncbi:DUF1761 domain-containing protein [Flavobacterium nackdongense]|uniref:DUF1761 domain-containing protein n=1 Tax=Flavobacterium nackdongense TaxID=2547394 RepID=A0A4P6YGX9_9FLAO|nr:DUF1761 domain-containing protein [Flavobacterium nackdongense]QBN19743.1 DUF1761 domain-containing protein [Flavobacterium nackdongense]